MFFDNPLDTPQGRYCLKACPKAEEIIQCQSNATSGANCRLRTSSYDTKAEINKIGAFCSPTDQSARLELFSQSEMGNKMSLTHGYDIIRFSLLTGFLVGLLYLAIMGCFPKWATLLSFGCAFFVLLTAGLYIFLQPVHLFDWDGWTTILAVILILVGIAYVLYMVFYRKEIELASIFIEHSNNYLKESYFVYLYIPFFLFLTIGFLILIGWQFIAFGTANYPTFDRSGVYYRSEHCIFLQVLNVIQLIWGLQFLRDACNLFFNPVNFVVSGNAVEWYFKTVTESRHCTKPIVRLLVKHWGSVVGGSFLNAFFKIFDIFSDFFNVIFSITQCDPRGDMGKCQTTYEKICCCNYIFELIRTDSYSYINLTGIPYCNAARQCEALCRHS